MVAADDSWYVRFPDGRVIRAANTTVVRLNIRQRHIPPGCMVRRSDDDAWRPMERTREFADLIGMTAGGLDGDPEVVARPREKPGSNAGMPTNGVGSRLDPQRLGTPGVPAVLREMLTALDLALTRRKLIAAVMAAAACGVVLAAAGAVAALAPAAAGFAWTACGVLVLCVVSAGLGMLAQLTSVELQRMRPALWREGRTGLGRLTWRLVLAHFVVVAVAMGVPGGLLALTHWLLSVTASPWEFVCTPLAHVTGVLVLLAAACLAPFVVASLLLAPILVFDSFSASAALRTWAEFVRRHFWRVVVNEAVIVLLAGLLAVPCLYPVLAAEAVPLDPRLALSAWCTRTLLTCLLLAPAAAFLAVANLFLFVNIRYESRR